MAAPTGGSALLSCMSMVWVFSLKWLMEKNKPAAYAAGLFVI